MKRPVDHEGLAGSPGPLFDFPALERTVRRAREVHASEPRIEVVSTSEYAACRPQPRPEYSTEYSGPTLADCIAHGDAEFPREIAELRRDLGMSRAAHAAERRAPGWEEQALADLRTFARTHARFAVEDFRAAFPPPEGVNPKALGAVVRRAARERIVVADGYVAVKCSNMSPRVAWKSLVYEGSPTP